MGSCSILSKVIILVGLGEGISDGISEGLSDILELMLGRLMDWNLGPRLGFD